MLENFLKMGKTMLENFLGVLNDLALKLDAAFIFLLFLRIKKGQGNGSPPAQSSAIGLSLSYRDSPYTALA
jgi:hypothetical protein